MKIKSSVTGAVLTLMLAGAAPVPAQGREATEAGAEAWRSAECEGAPLAVVAGFLSLAPEQVQALRHLLQERQRALAPIQQAIAAHEQLIRLLIATGGDPARIGRLVVEIHQLRQLAEGVQARFLTGFESLLGDEQRERWQQVRVAATLQPVLPAFQALQVL
jgi:Spy/CpxP family protein refolding chaperone